MFTWTHSVLLCLSGKMLEHSVQKRWGTWRTVFWGDWSLNDLEFFSSKLNLFCTWACWKRLGAEGKGYGGQTFLPGWRGEESLMRPLEMINWLIPICFNLDKRDLAMHRKTRCVCSLYIYIYTYIYIYYEFYVNNYYLSWIRSLLSFFLTHFNIPTRGFT